MELKVDEKFIEPIVRDQIAAAVVAQLGNTEALVKSMVNLALRTKTDSKGNVSGSSYENKYDFVEAIAGATIRDAASAAIKKIIEEQRPAIEASIVAELRRAPKKTAAAILSAFVDGAVKNPYRLNVQFNFDPMN